MTDPKDTFDTTDRNSDRPVMFRKFRFLLTPARQRVLERGLEEYVIEKLLSDDTSLDDLEQRLSQILDRL